MVNRCLEGEPFGIQCPPRLHIPVQVLCTKLKNRLRFACCAIPAGYWTCSSVVSNKVEAPFLFFPPVLVTNLSQNTVEHAGRVLLTKLCHAAYFLVVLGFDSSTTMTCSAAASWDMRATVITLLQSPRPCVGRGHVPTCVNTGSTFSRPSFVSDNGVSRDRR